MGFAIAGIEPTGVGDLASLAGHESARARNERFVARNGLATFGNEPTEARFEPSDPRNELADPRNVSSDPGFEDVDHRLRSDVSRR